MMYVVKEVDSFGNKTGRSFIHSGREDTAIDAGLRLFPQAFGFAIKEINNAEIASKLKADLETLDVMLKFLKAM